MQITELFNSLHLNIPQILFRIPALFALLYEPCHYCHRRLNEVDGYPLGRIGWLPYAPKPAPPPESAVEKKDAAEGEKQDGEKDDKPEANGEKEDGDATMADGEKKDDAEKEKEETKDEDKDKKDGKLEVEDKKEDGRWVCWHQSCLAQVR